VDPLLEELVSFPSLPMELFTLLVPMLEDSISLGVPLPLTAMATILRETGQTATPTLALLSSPLGPSLDKVDQVFQ